MSVETTDGGTVITGPDITTYRLLATLHGLRMEINMQQRHGCPPASCPTRGMAFTAAKRELATGPRAVQGAPVPRTRKQALERFEAMYPELVRGGEGA